MYSHWKHGLGRLAALGRNAAPQSAAGTGGSLILLALRWGCKDHGRGFPGGAQRLHTRGTSPHRLPVSASASASGSEHTAASQHQVAVGADCAAPRVGRPQGAGGPGSMQLTWVSGHGRARECVSGAASAELGDAQGNSRTQH